MRRLYYILILLGLISCKEKQNKNELTFLQMSDSLKNTSLGVEYQRLYEIYNRENLDSIGKQSRVVLRLINNYNDPFIAEILNFCANCLRSSNMTFDNFRDFTNKDTIINLYQTAYNICKTKNLFDNYTFSESLFQLAECLEQDDKLSEATDLRKEYFFLIQNHYGKNEQMTADALMWLASNYQRQNHLDSALKYYRIELNIRKQYKDTMTIRFREEEIKRIEKTTTHNN
jgi:hypothetical protein